MKDRVKSIYRNHGKDLVKDVAVVIGCSIAMYDKCDGSLPREPELEPDEDC